MTHRPATSGRGSFWPCSRSQDAYSRRRGPKCNIVATGHPDCGRRRRSFCSAVLARRAVTERQIGTKSLCAHSYKGTQEPVARPGSISSQVDLKSSSMSHTNATIPAMTSTETFRAQLVALLPNLRAFAMSLLGNRDRADDLTQETILKAWLHMDSF